jgi:hypothetical protein
MGDTPEREKGVYPWQMYKELRRGVKGKRIVMGGGTG